MSGDAVQIVARGSRGAAEAAAAAVDVDPRLEGATYSILEEDEARGVWRIDAFPTSDEEADAFEAVLSGEGWAGEGRSQEGRADGADGQGRGVDGLVVSREALADADWLAMALSGLPPVRAGRFFVYGAHDRGRRPANAVALRIEAGAAFGTGHHGTTVGCLLAYDALLKRERFDRVLDVGTGTGVLAIAAAKCGAREVVGTDIDPVSVRIARENAGLNQARARFVRADGLGHRLVASHAPFDLVFANILAAPLVGLAPDIAGVLAPGGVAILSGLLRHQARRVRAAYLSRGLRLERVAYRDAWTTLVLRRP